jgi:hypothetical protein
MRNEVKRRRGEAESLNYDLNETNHPNHPNHQNDPNHFKLSISIRKLAVIIPAGINPMSSPAPFQCNAQLSLCKDTHPVHINEIFSIPINQANFIADIKSSIFALTVRINFSALFPLYLLP